MIPYNPLAGGLLTGNIDATPRPTTGRFTLGTAGSMYQDATGTSASSRRSSNCRRSWRRPANR